MRSIWKGAINFGLVNIPVKLYSATQQSNLDLDMVDSRDRARIRFLHVNGETGKEVKWEDIAKAYLYNDEYIILDKQDFADAAPKKSKVIEIDHFIEKDEIDPIYYENSYYIEPGKSGERAYVLLREALTKSGKAGVAQFVLRTAEALTVIRPFNEMLLLNKIRFAQEIRSPEEFNIPGKSIIKPAELKMATSLIEQYSTPFDIEKYKDEYTSALLKIIKAKAAGKKVKVQNLQVVYSRTQNLMDQLKASLSKKKAS